MKKLICFLCLGFYACTESTELVGVLSKTLAAGPALLTPIKDQTLDNGCWDKSNSIVWDFDWSDVSGAEQYHLYVKGLNAMYPVIDAYITASEYHYLCDRCYIAPSNAKNWSWKVRAKVNGAWSDWSSLTFEAEDIDTDCKVID
jgi:hypothetical protein